MNIHNPRFPTGGLVSILRIGIFIKIEVLLALFVLFDPGFLLATDPQSLNPSATLKPVTNAPIVRGASASNAPASIPQAAVDVSRVSTNGMDALDNKHRLAIGDRLSFRIVEDEDDPKHLDVTDSGDLEAPYLGRFPAEGKTCKELALALKAGLEKEYYYQATVIVAVDLMARSRGKVYLVGPVRGPGPLEIPSDEIFTLSKAILRAGGFTDFADKRNVRVTRKATVAGGRDQTFTVDVKMILEKGKTGLDLPLAPGDFIYVSERAIRF
jgi:protein involved in polysaccharide export with SLBB domain